MDFTAHSAAVAEADARIMKQNRLLRAELGANPRGLPGQAGGSVQLLADSSDDQAPGPAAGDPSAAKPKGRPRGKGKKA